MIEISHRLRNTIKINPHNENMEDIHRFTVIAFIKEYVKHPSFDYYMCDDAAVSKFDVMPAVKGLRDEELQAVAEWIYDYFEDKEF